MTTTINASTSAGLVQTADTSGILQLQTAGTAAVTVDASQRVGIGTDTPISTTLQTLQVQSGGSIVTALSGVGYGISPSISLRNAGGTSASPTASTLSPMNVVGSTTSDGTNFFNTVGIAGGIESTPTAGSHPTFFAVSTTASGSTSRTERFRVNSTGTITLQGGSTSSNGIGITFPATQSASTDANTLDDYEEGTWTPVLSASTTPPTVSSYTTQQGVYTKIGNLVTATCNIRATLSNVGSGTPIITGLPFTEASYIPGVAVGLVSIANNVSTSLGTWYISGTSVYSGGTMAYNLNANAYFTFTVSYRI